MTNRGDRGDRPPIGGPIVASKIVTNDCDRSASVRSHSPGADPGPVLRPGPGHPLLLAHQPTGEPRLEADRAAVLLEEIGNGLVGELLEVPHAVSGGARGRHQFRRRPEYFRGEAFVPVALALEVRPVNGGSGLDLGTRRIFS
jgi:hypothetical protein